MRVAFVGVERKYRELAPEYHDSFDQYHLELPYYYAVGCNDVTITTVDDSSRGRPVGSGWLERKTEDEFRKSRSRYDVVVHWRKWREDLYVENAVNVINCQDHSFGPEWKSTVLRAYSEGKLYGILTFPTWHTENAALELDGRIPFNRFLSGVTLGVDTDIYHPDSKKDPRQLLWASDPGRGMEGAVRLAVELWRRDKRFKLHVCYPDYVKKPVSLAHPAVKIHGVVPNGPKLWALFNECGTLPYTSTFREPSSRAHRQAQAAGSLVLYPRNMGSPSFLIDDGKNGYVRDPSEWADLIVESIETGEHAKLGQAARELAVSENWAVQAKRFNSLFATIIGATK